MKDNTRLKRLLEKKQRAKMMPRNKLVDYEEEYSELLSRIESERKQLGIDDGSISALKIQIAKEVCGSEFTKIRKKDKEVSNRIAEIERKLDRAARFGNLEEIEYELKMLKEAWRSLPHQKTQSRVQPETKKKFDNPTTQMSLF